MPPSAPPGLVFQLTSGRVDLTSTFTGYWNLQASQFWINTGSILPNPPLLLGTQIMGAVCQGTSANFWLYLLGNGLPQNLWNTVSVPDLPGFPIFQSVGDPNFIFFDDSDDEGGTPVSVWAFTLPTPIIPNFVFNVTYSLTFT